MSRRGALTARDLPKVRRTKPWHIRTHAGSKLRCTQLSCSMQPPVVPRRNPGPTFTNHTPRAWEITAVDPSQFPISSDVFGPTGMNVGSASIMGQSPSRTQRDDTRDVSSTIFRQDSIQQTEEESHYISPSFRTDSIHYTHTSQAPNNGSIEARFAHDTAIDNDKMMTQTSLSRLPRENASHDLAFFLRTTGPTAPHVGSSRARNPRRTLSAPKKLRFFNLGSGSRRLGMPARAAHERFVCELKNQSSLALSANIF